MEKIISGYFKTNHAMLRQWQRGIDDRLLEIILRIFHPNPRRKVLLVLPSDRLLDIAKKLRMEKSIPVHEDLVLVMKHHTIYTMFFQPEGKRTPENYRCRKRN